MDDMYKEEILELFKNPLNFGDLPDRTHSHRAYNPLCGDDITMQVKIKDHRVEDIKFKGSACAICTASSSLITDEVKGQELSKADDMTKDDVLDMLEIPISPVRLKCALLPLEALQKATKDESKVN